MRRRWVTVVMIAAVALLSLQASLVWAGAAHDKVYAGEVLQAEDYHPWALVISGVLALAFVAAGVGLIAYLRDARRLARAGMLAASVAGLPAVLPTLIGAVAWRRLSAGPG
ncbi:hypothetical protein ACQPZJ_08985 [Actinoplanes sp. CA-054009]